MKHKHTPQDIAAYLRMLDETRAKPRPTLPAKDKPKPPPEKTPF